MCFSENLCSKLNIKFLEFVVKEITDTNLKPS